MIYCLSLLFITLSLWSHRKHAKENLFRANCKTFVWDPKSPLSSYSAPLCTCRTLCKISNNIFRTNVCFQSVCWVLSCYLERSQVIALQSWNILLKLCSPNLPFYRIHYESHRHEWTCLEAG